MTSAKPSWPTLNFLIIALGLNVLSVGRRFRVDFAISGSGDLAARVLSGPSCLSNEPGDSPPGAPTGKSDGGHQAELAVKARWILSITSFSALINRRFSASSKR